MQPSSELRFTVKTKMAALAIAGTAVLGAAAMPREGPRQRLVVVELFQSQGCSSCPPALANLNAITDRPDVLALSYGVTYWDQLGWKDSFASPKYTARQWDYAHHYGRGEVATPQVWIDGRGSIVGSNAAQFRQSLASAPALDGPDLRFVNAHVAVAQGRAPSGGAEVWLVRYDPRTIQVAIRAGENGGRTLAHRDIVRQLVELGHWTGNAASFPIPTAPRGDLKTAVFVQLGRGGPIVSAAKL